MIIMFWEQRLRVHRKIQRLYRLHARLVEHPLRSRGSRQVRVRLTTKSDYPGQALPVLDPAHRGGVFLLEEPTATYTQTTPIRRWQRVQLLQIPHTPQMFLPVTQTGGTL